MDALGQLTVVPPTSTTSAISFLALPLAQLAKKCAPRIELVGPLENVFIGKWIACSRFIKVPSFEVRKTGQSSFKALAEDWKAATTLLA